MRSELVFRPVDKKTTAHARLCVSVCLRVCIFLFKYFLLILPSSSLHPEMCTFLFFPKSQFPPLHTDPSLLIPTIVIGRVKKVSSLLRYPSRQATIFFSPDSEELYQGGVTRVEVHAILSSSPPPWTGALTVYGNRHCSDRSTLPPRRLPTREHSQ